MSGYDWDPSKAESNLRKHGVSFLDAEEVLRDPLAQTRPDPSADERWSVTGFTRGGQMIVVIVSESGSRPRIISARRATKRERHAYERR